MSVAVAYYHNLSQDPMRYLQGSARLSSLDGSLGAINANDNAPGQTTVEILSSDVAFETTCTWAPLG